MKSTLYTTALALLILSSCSTAYQTAQTPDDVYYSPKTQRVASGNNSDRQDNSGATYTEASGDEGTYVTYDDEDQGDYARRIDRFNNSNYKGSYYDDGFYGSPNIYMNNYYGSMYSPYSSWGWGGYYSPWSYGYGWPYYSSYWGPSISIGIGWGWGGGYYSPWAYSPWYGGGGWYNPWWGGGYYGHVVPGYGYALPNRSYRTRSSFGGGNVGGYSGGRVGTGSVVNPGGRVGSGTDYRPRRITNVTNPGDNSGGRIGSGSRIGTTDGSSRPVYQPRRIFNSSGSERPVINNGGSREGNGSPSRVFQPQAPQRSYQPSYTPSAPSRSSGSFGGSSGGGGRVGGGGGGGRTRN